MAMADKGSARRRSTSPAGSAALVDDAPSVAGPGPTIESYFGAFASVGSWTDLCAWPPDVFALANLVLDHTEAYRFAVDPPSPGAWPPSPTWNSDVVVGAREWRRAAAVQGRAAPPSVRRQWDIVVAGRGIPLSDLRTGASRPVWEALLTLHAMADESCAGLASAGTPFSDDGFERRAWKMLAAHGSLSRISPARVRITPKTNLASRGISIRSLSRYLALDYESVELVWRRWEEEAGRSARLADDGELNMLLVPWPLRILGRAFHAIESPIGNLDQTAYGFFEFAPKAELDLALLRRMIETARRLVGRVDAVMQPETAVQADEVARLEAVLAEEDVAFLVAGVRVPAGSRGLGRNYVHAAMRTATGWSRFEQAKHHRWSLDEGQIQQYHLGRSLSPSKQWWEAIDLPSRSVQVVDIGRGTTIVPLVCEDLARLDEVADLLRRVGPSLVVALLLDGPQLIGRWSHRYAAVLSDEPGSAVLTLTSFGMVARSRPPGTKTSRAVALWSDPSTGTHSLDLARGAAGIVVTAKVRAKTAWTADGRRHHESTPAVELAGCTQLRVKPARKEAQRTWMA